MPSLLAFLRSSPRDCASRRMFLAFLSIRKSCFALSSSSSVDGNEDVDESLLSPAESHGIKRMRSISVEAASSICLLAFS